VPAIDKILILITVPMKGKCCRRMTAYLHIAPPASRKTHPCLANCQRAEPRRREPRRREASCSLLRRDGQVEVGYLDVCTGWREAEGS